MDFRRMNKHQSFRLTPSRFPSIVIKWLKLAFAQVTTARLLFFIVTLFLGVALGFSLGEKRGVTRQNHELAEVQYEHLHKTYDDLRSLRFGSTNGLRLLLESQLDFDIIAVCNNLTNAPRQRAWNYRILLNDISAYRAKYPASGLSAGYEMSGSIYIAKDLLEKATKEPLRY